MYSILTESYDQGFLNKPSYIFLPSLVHEVSQDQSKSSKHLTSFLRHCMSANNVTWMGVYLQIMVLEDQRETIKYQTQITRPPPFECRDRCWRQWHQACIENGGWTRIGSVCDPECELRCFIIELQLCLCRRAQIFEFGWVKVSQWHCEKNLLMEPVSRSRSTKWMPHISSNHVRIEFCQDATLTQQCKL